MKISRTRLCVLILSYLLAAFAVMGGFIYANFDRAEQFERKINNTYQRAFAELSSGLNSIDISLQKCLYAASPAMTAAICTEIFGKTTAAQMALGEMPFSTQELEQTAGFVAKLGDYVYALSRSAAEGTALTEEQYANLTSLSETAALLAGNLTQLQADVHDGRITLTELQQAESQADQAEEGAGIGSLSDSFKAMESEFPDIPSLIYDGPFSEHINSMTPKMTAGTEEISQEEAISIAADFLGVKEAAFSLSGVREGNLPVYLLSSRIDGGEVSVEVTKYGGIVATMSNSRLVDNPVMTGEDAVQLARAYLEKHGYTDMQESYWEISGGICTVNFAYTQDGVICYPDLIKVSIALDSGTTVCFEAQGYIMSHTVRDIPAPEITQEAAASKISPQLRIVSHAMTIIPSAGKYEIFCHAFTCETKSGQHCMVYINAVTGEEEKILILLESESGTLVM